MSNERESMSVGTALVIVAAIAAAVALVVTGHGNWVLWAFVLVMVFCV